MITEKPTEQDSREWANFSLVRRAEFDNRVYELNSNNGVYVLKRRNIEPKKAGQSGSLELIGVIKRPEDDLLAKIMAWNKL